MKIIKLVADSEDLVPFANQLKKSMSLDYTNQSDKMIIMAEEVYKLRNTSMQLNLVVLKLVDLKIEIDIIGAAGAGSFLGGSWWSESGFVKSMRRQIENICELNGVAISPRFD